MLRLQSITATVNGPHPLVRLLALLLLAILVQLLAWRGLLVLSAMLIVLLVVLRVVSLFRVLRRARWLLLSLLLIYAFATPGEYWMGFPLPWQPTYEGMLAGVLQATRVVLMLAGLALLLATTTREQLIAGVYMLLRPMQVVGVAPERFAARLWLTLHYVEQAPLPQRHMMHELLESFDGHAGFANAPEKIAIQLPRLHALDVVLILVMLGAGIVLL